jgi:hypothetical protein
MSEMRPASLLGSGVVGGSAYARWLAALVSSAESSKILSLIF